MLKSNLMLSTAVALVLALRSPMAAAVTTDEIVAAHQAQGYGYIEVTRGLT